MKAPAWRRLGNRSARVGFGALSTPLRRDTRGASPRLLLAFAACSALIAAVSLLGGSSLSAAVAAEACPNEAFRTGPSAGLADCRAYEQVSPTEKGGNDAVERRGYTAALTSPSGESLSYRGLASFPGADGNPALLSAHLSLRGPGGWQTDEISPAKVEARAQFNYLAGYDFSEELSQAVVEVQNQALAPGSTPGAFNLFLRHPDGSYSLVNDATPTLLPSEICGEIEVCPLIADLPAFAGASTDFSHILFESNAQLTPEAPETFIESLYESAGGKVSLVGILPDGSPAAEGATAGAGSSIEYFGGIEPRADKRVEHAISADGSRVVFQARADGGEPDPAQSGMTEVYDRIGGSETIELSAPAPGATPANPAPESATYWAASADGSRVFFTSSAELTTDSDTGTANDGEALYEYDLATHSLTDLTVDANPADAATGPRVLGVVNASHDGSYVYFVAEGQLVEGEGEAGKPNLYLVREGGEPVFIATLGDSDSRDWTATPSQLTAYVTPDGRHLAFSSLQSLPTANFPSGYDNAIASGPTCAETVGGGELTGSEPRCSEVYLYSAESGRLDCASCDPNGARPLGNAYLGGTNQSLTESGSTPFQPVRALNEAGTRLFFVSPDPLAGESKLAGSPSPYRKVYEYEQGGEGSCTSTAACTYLISSAANSEEDIFLDASASGNDVFFATLGRLSPGDEDSLIDVYDARVDGGFPSAGATECQSGCRQAPATPAPPAGLTAATGPSGNLKAPAQKKKHKQQQKKHKKKHHKKKHSSKRAGKGNRKAGK